MNPGPSEFSFKALFWSFDGREPRSLYCWWCIFPHLLSYLSFIFGRALIDSIEPESSVDIFGILGLCSMVLSIWAGVVIGAKRLHDRGRSAGLLALYGIPLANMWLIIELAFLRGTLGPNKYGPDPLESQ
ncbi:MAG: DUF805 domain-containing protein [Candidatus Latescibacteria bacterium]|nr:DUF805 domain-containing protein [Candidatus Latescibacterota bacterium]